LHLWSTGGKDQGIRCSLSALKLLPPSVVVDLWLLFILKNNLEAVLTAHECMNILCPMGIVGGIQFFNLTKLAAVSIYREWG